jgi:hypothetical protein
MTRLKTTAAILFAALTLGAGIASASAETRFEDNHPRRAEVLARARVENHRIADARQGGDITARQAHRLHERNREIVQREQRLAHRQGGSITRGEQVRLNRAENRLARHTPG